MSQSYFMDIRNCTIGANQKIVTPFGIKPLIYFDWTASGRMYRPIEEKLMNEIGPYVANTHSEANTTGTVITHLYKDAISKIKAHFGANKDDVFITDGSGATGVINRLQRMLGLRLHENFRNKISIDPSERPIVFVTHMEHHSNHTSWYETIADVVILQPEKDLTATLSLLSSLLIQYKDRPLKIGSFTACSNVTGVKTSYHEYARVMHQHGGVCFVDFAASAPYEEINMHPEDSQSYLDGIFFSPHKFLGGVGTSGVLIFNKNLYKNEIPDQPGGGTVLWTNPWGEHEYFTNIEIREDGGTPPFLQVIRTAMAISLKEQMLEHGMEKRKKELLDYLWIGLKKINGIHILDENNTNRAAIVSFYVENIHYNLLTTLLDHLYGIQVRSGCSCAGTYGHYMLDIDYETSNEITQAISSGYLNKKPGWVRVSLHPTNTFHEIDQFLNGLQDIIQNVHDYKADYIYREENNTFYHKLNSATPSKPSLHSQV